MHLHYKIICYYSTAIMFLTVFTHHKQYAILQHVNNTCAPIIV